MHTTEDNCSSRGATERSRGVYEHRNAAKNDRKQLRSRARAGSCLRSRVGQLSGGRVWRLGRLGAWARIAE